MSDHVTTVIREPRPSRVERFSVDGHDFTASLIDPPGREATWHIRLDGDDDGPVTHVVAAHLDDAIADLEADAARQRARAQVHLDLADQADGQRFLVESLAQQMGATPEPEPEPVDQPVHHGAAKPPPPTG